MGIMTEARRVQYARTYPELHDLFERNGIDVWMTMSDIVGQTDAAGIEWSKDRGVLRWKLVEALRNADISGQDRAVAVAGLERERVGDEVAPFAEEDNAIEVLKAPVVFRNLGERAASIMKGMTSGN